MFLISKLILEMLAPMSIFFGLIFISLLFFVFRKKIVACAIIVFSFAFLLFFSYDIGQNLLAAPLENAIEIYDPANFENIKTVVVLGGGRHPESNRAVSAKLTNITLVRLVEGIRVFNVTDANNLIVTGRDYTSNSSIAALMKQCAVDLGVDEHKIITVDNARNTREEAKYTAEFARGDSVFLVSSASHLKRAKKNFEREGIFVVPIATDYQIQYHKKKTPGYFFPNPNRLANVDRSIHEYLGLLYEIFRK